MPTVYVDIQPAIINWALSQTHEEQLGNKLMENIRHWLDGTKTPTFKQIESFSKKSNIPLGYFFLQTPPVEQLHLLDYRTVDSIHLANPSRNLIDTIHEMENVQDWMIDYRRDTGFDVLPIVGSMKGYTDVKVIVNTIRDDLSLKDNWYEDCGTMNDAFHMIRSLLEECGVIVMQSGIAGKNTHRALDIEEFRAFAMPNEWAPLIFINGADSQGAKLFSLFHEVAHIWLGVSDLYNDRRDSKNVKPIEVLCNSVASELMIPTEHFIEKWDASTIEDVFKRVSELAKKFKCSESAVARKALDNKRIVQSVYAEVIENSLAAYQEMKDNRNSNGGNYYNTMASRLDGRFIKALCESISTGRTTFTEAYRLTNTSRKTFAEIAARQGGIQ